MLSKNDVGEKLKFEIEKLKNVVNFNESTENNVGIGEPLHTATVIGIASTVDRILDDPQKEVQSNNATSPSQESLKEDNMFFKK